ncbi:LuxR family transcriptional regulator [Actinoplanes sp. SE50]|nr:transcriptional regulator, LuxR family [Actinoplanes sp. SE50/110]ATO83423.1 LuxR family transcriptional regulator [Actinoplanes sp. SE50]SLM00830.1 Protease production enhancer protein [Actinoplanes sp. SE50/110]
MRRPRPGRRVVSGAQDPAATRWGETVETLQAHLFGRDIDGLAALLVRAGVRVTPLRDEPQATVVVSGATVAEALDACPETYRKQRFGLLVVAESLDAAGVRHGFRAGVRAMLPRAGVTPDRLAAALHSAGQGDRRIPYPAMVKLLAGAAPAPRELSAEPLTPQQARVLRMIAEGQSNAAIARDLACSEHTVKNAVYDLMARLHVNNRAHAVARGIRTGLI